ncbi:TPA: 3'-5' exonuclease [Burkholderia cepacia]|nr:3'-5' exonuclease [Burkholderia cepacia]HEM8509752.1 3'-5' exonuclease [Burkholderia cepacia]
MEMLDTQWTQWDFAVVDVEGNGETPQEIIELAIFHISAGELMPQHDEWLVRPQKPVTAQATAFHGIKNEMLAGQPSLSDVAEQVFAALGSKIVIGHNVRVDVELLKKAIPNWHPVLVLDTLKLARAVHPSARSYALSSLVSERQIDIHSSTFHRASGDARATAYLFLDLIKTLEASRRATLRKLVDIAAIETPEFINNQQQDLF